MIEWQVCLRFDKSYCICTSIYIEIDIKVCCTEHFCQSIIVYNVVTCTLRCLIIYYFRWHPTLNSIRIPRTNTDQYRRYSYQKFTSPTETSSHKFTATITPSIRRIQYFELGGLSTQLYWTVRKPPVRRVVWGSNRKWTVWKSTRIRVCNPRPTG